MSIRTLVILFLFLFFGAESFGSIFETQEITWRQLRQLNVKTGEMPIELKKLMGKPVKIPGYAVPIEGDGGFDYILSLIHI